MQVAPVVREFGVVASKRPSSVDKHISRRILERRESLNLTQPDLAERAGVSFQQFQKYENGENRVPAGRLYEIARALKIGVAYFFPGGEGSGAIAVRGVAEEGAEFEGAPDESAELVRIFKSLDTAKRKSVLTMVRKEAAAAPKKKRKRS
jgi:transcriptional regulator with XRE-family HTH domain